ncbi:hypothetical protein [Streptomyces sulphureus]|uniref:hypothetical protein n=1 Tax=Streptomyces sulphureus TaxID=47758 RepID=UPI001B7F7B64|nr:hypothetical protein [Streptomyces sulphureus]
MPAGDAGRARLREGDPAGAAAFARESVALLERTGDMPALRSEEVLFHAARALYAAGARSEAEELLSRAREKMERKAESIEDPALLRGFREDVPLNRALALGDLESE